MTALQEAKALLPKLTKTEKAQLIHWVSAELAGVFPGIEKTPGICGGEACIENTRIPVWLLVRQRQLGISEDEQLRDYPTLRLGDLKNAWHYFEHHKSEIKNQVRENEAD